MGNSFKDGTQVAFAEVLATGAVVSGVIFIAATEEQKNQIAAGSRRLFEEVTEVVKKQIDASLTIQFTKQFTKKIASYALNVINAEGADKPADKPAEPSPDSTSAADKAKELGYDRKVKDPPFNSHGQPVFTNGKDFITPDVDQHNGGEWKGFDRRGRRTGTYDENLDRIGK